MYVGPWQEYKLMKVIEDLHDENERLRQQQQQQQLRSSTSSSSDALNNPPRGVRRVKGIGEVFVGPSQVDDPFETYPLGHPLSSSRRELLQQPKMTVARPGSDKARAALKRSSINNNKNINTSYDDSFNRSVEFNGESANLQGALHTSPPSASTNEYAAARAKKGGAFVETAYNTGGNPYSLYTSYIPPDLSGSVAEKRRVLGAAVCGHPLVQQLAGPPLDTRAVGQRAGQAVYERRVLEKKLTPAQEMRKKEAEQMLERQERRRRLQKLYAGEGGGEEREEEEEEEAEEKEEGVGRHSKEPVWGAEGLRQQPSLDTAAAGGKSTATAVYVESSSPALLMNPSAGDWGVPWDHMVEPANGNLDAAFSSSPLKRSSTKNMEEITAERRDDVDDDDADGNEVIGGHAFSGKVRGDGNEAGKKIATAVEMDDEDVDNLLNWADNLDIAEIDQM